MSRKYYFHMLEEPCSCGLTEKHRHCIFCDYVIRSIEDFDKHGEETGHYACMAACSEDKSIPIINSPSKGAEA